MAAAILAILVAATLGGCGSAAHGAGSTRAPSRGVPATSAVPLAHYVEKAPHVSSQTIVYGVQGGVRGAPATPPAELPPVSAAAFRRPVAHYLAYSGRQLSVMLTDVGRLRTALASDRRALAQSAWLAAYADYLRLGAVYLEGRLGALDQRIDGTVGGDPGGTRSPRFTGLHRIEMGLWTGAPLGSLIPWTDGLATDVMRMRRTLPRVTIDPLDYATRAHEILEDAVRDLLSGTDVPWSGAGVVGTAAGVQATTEVVRTLTPVLGQIEGIIPAVNTEMRELRAALTDIRREHGGTLPDNAELTQMQREQLDAAIGQALEALAQIPGALETVRATAPPPIPARQARTDP